MRENKRKMVRLLNTTEIAFLAGVKKATVSMWKKRHDNFPKPVTHKLYDADEIEEWLGKWRNK